LIVACGPEVRLLHEANGGTSTFDVISVNVLSSTAVSDELSGLGRYSGPATLILSSLADGEKHGYGLAKDIAKFAGVELQPGTLYGAISRLEQQGLIEALPGDGRRRPYRLTSTGAVALHTHLTTQRQVADAGLRRLAAGWSFS
jgi:DNA-binding PadR family transcriptional regulator